MEQVGGEDVLCGGFQSQNTSGLWLYSAGAKGVAPAGRTGITSGSLTDLKDDWTKDGDTERGDVGLAAL